ncbi:MAG: adenylosuccinate synthase [Clostridiaceae bacterium]|nr:adenylosuccinate synthase [Clostridiaceae bacterium]MDY3284997.1 adenylosuccinate synthase [Eubacteriales bacterium]MDY5014431.1 adenylosuccinate synthase [Eubacteriales bacterium]
MLSAIVGINWGDEGKGRMVDLLSSSYDIIIRYQGGNNAGHTVVNERGKFILNLMPSGILRENVVNVCGPGMVIDLAHLVGEIKKLTDAGVRVSPSNLKISDRAVICMPYHRKLDELEEDRLADRKFGSTRRGIGPVYGDKYMKKVLRCGDLLEPDTLRDKVANLLEWKNLTIAGGYHADPVSVDEEMAWLEEYGSVLAPFVCDTTKFLSNAIAAGKNLMFEAQLGALRDIDFGIFPYTSSSPTIAAYAPIGAGIPFAKLDRVLGIMKAYSTCVGEGPFTAEMFGDEAEELRRAGGEYGAATGRPRRVGGFDVVASRYGCKMQGADSLALTKLDVLSYCKEIPVCEAYSIDGLRVEEFPWGDALSRAKPIYTTLPGFEADISKVRRASDLPYNARAYIEYLQRAVDTPISIVSVGAERDAYIEL